jgi:hypothetical protein
MEPFALLYICANDFIENKRRRIRNGEKDEKSVSVLFNLLTIYSVVCF